MRISEQDRQSINATAKEFFGANCSVRLFGSRADDRRRGGDIDLHIVPDHVELATLDRELSFTVTLKDRIGDQKIDIILQKPGTPDRLIDIVAKESGIIL